MSVSLKLFGVSKTNTAPFLTCNYYRRILLSDSAFSVATKYLESFLGNAILLTIKNLSQGVSFF